MFVDSEFQQWLNGDKRIVRRNKRSAALKWAKIQSDLKLHKHRRKSKQDKD